MVASVQKNTTEFLTEYLHFSCPFDNFLRCLACATNIAVGKKVLSTTDVHGQYRNQIHSTSKFLPAWYWDWHCPSMPNCQQDYSCWECIYWVQGNVRQHQGGLDNRQCISQFWGAFCPSVLVQHRQWHSWRMVSTPVLQGIRNWEEKSISHILQCSC